MTRKVYVSRHDLTPCPACGRHARLDRDAPQQATCTFCGESLLAAPSPQRSALSKLARAGRHGVVAGSLLGAVALAPAACSTDSPAYGDPAALDTSTDDAADDATDTADDAETTDIPVGPVYGSPADTMDDEDTTEPGDTANDEDVEIEDAADAGFEPEYGIAPDAAP